MSEWLERTADQVWSPWMLGLFLAVGLWCSLRSGFFQLFGLRRWLGGLTAALRDGGTADGFSPAQALSTTLASTIGTGSIAGVATAITFGGPGALFWMWVSALLGMMTGFYESYFALSYRRPGEPPQGPVAYLERGLGWRAGSLWFSLWCVLSALSGGAMIQSHSITDALERVCPLPPAAVGCLTAVTAGAVILGGLNRIGRVSELLTPVMSLLFLLTGGLILWLRREALPDVFRDILTCALTPGAAAGGVTGSTVTAALRYGVARGVFTNEAGVGSSPLAHAAASVPSPESGGFSAMFQVCFATLIVCTVSGLVILTSGVRDPSDPFFTGAALSAAAFGSVLGPFGEGVVVLCTLLFAFTSLLGWCFYGTCGLEALTGSCQLTRSFQVCYLLCAFLGSLGTSGGLWALSDLCTAGMALPNLLALVLLTGRENPGFPPRPGGSGREPRR